HPAVGAAGQPFRRLFLGEVEAPVPRSDRDPASKPEERHAVDLRALAMQDVGGAPATARLAQGALRLVVAGNEHCRRFDDHEHVDDALESPVHGGEVARRYHRVDIGGSLGETSRLAVVAMAVAEGEQAHGPLQAIEALEWT